MANETIYLYRYAVSLHKEGWATKKEVFAATETAKSYCYEDRRISKSKLGIIDTIFYPHHSSYRFFLFSTEDNQDLFFGVLKRHIKAKAEIIKKELEAILSFTDNI